MRLGTTISSIYPNIVIDVDFTLSADRLSIDKWITKEIPQPTPEALDTAWAELEIVQQAEQAKIDKRTAILKIASISDQLNIIADVLDTLTSETPDQSIIADAKAKFNEIKTILDN